MPKLSDHTRFCASRRPGCTCDCPYAGGKYTPIAEQISNHAPIGQALKNYPTKRLGSMEDGADLLKDAGYMTVEGVRAVVETIYDGLYIRKDEHDRRVAELLNANTALIEEGRKVVAELEAARALNQELQGKIEFRGGIKVLEGE